MKAGIKVGFNSSLRKYYVATSFAPFFAHQPHCHPDMSTHEVLTRLRKLSENSKQLTIRITLLTRPTSSESTTTSSDASSEPAQDTAQLSSEIHQELNELEEDFELAKQQAEDITTVGSWSSGARRANEERDRERIAIASQIERLSGELKLARAQYRRAQLQVKRNKEAAQRKEREQLFAGIQDGDTRSGNKRRGQEKLSEDEILRGASDDVTAALRRTHQLMTAELQRSQFAHETLQRSTAALQSLNESYSNLDTLLSSSKSLISTLVSSSKSDTWYLETTLWVLVSTFCWLVFRRIFYGPIRYLAYLPTKWMLKIFLSLLQLFAGGVIAASSGDTSAVSSYAPQSSVASEIPLGKREGRANPALPRIHIPSGMGGQGAKAGAGVPSDQGTKQKKLSDDIADMADKPDEQAQEQSTEHGTDPDIEAEGDEEQWTAAEGEDTEEHGTVLREPEADESPNAKKRMWEEPEEGSEHDEL